MELRVVGENKTRLKLKNSIDGFAIEQLKFFGAVPAKESKMYTYFEFDYNMSDCRKYLGLG